MKNQTRRSPNSLMMAAYAALIGVTAAACTTAPTVPESYDGDPAKGRELAERLCSSCHSIEISGPSPRPTAPPLRDVLYNYPAHQLEEDLQKSSHIAFLQMPQFHLGEHGGADLVSYITAIAQP